MEKLLFTLVFCLLYGVAEAQINKSVDEFRGTTTYSTDYFRITVEQGPAVISTGVFLKVDGDEGYIFIHRMSFSYNVGAIDSRYFFLIDGQRIVKDAALNPPIERNNGRYEKTTALQFETWELGLIAVADEARFKVGNDIYQINQDGLTLATELLKTIEP